MSRRAKTLSDEDRILWNRIARTAKPLPGKTRPPEEQLPVQMALPPEPAAPLPPPASPPPAKPPRLAPVGRHLDLPTKEKLANGRLPIDAKVDLHGLTQSEAHGLLLGFLHRAHARGLRYVIVVTGKGSRGDGVLRRLVPEWLATAAFRSVVSGHDGAARGHGGGGALYVRLRRHGSGPAA